MSSTILNVIGGILFWVGLAFNVSGCIGLVRLPDLYNRLQASTKCVTLGTVLLFAGLVFMYIAKYGNGLQMAVHLGLALGERVEDRLGLPDKDPGVPIELARVEVLPGRCSVRLLAETLDAVGRQPCPAVLLQPPRTLDIAICLGRIGRLDAKGDDAARALLHQVGRKPDRLLERLVRAYDVVGRHHGHGGVVILASHGQCR